MLSMHLSPLLFLSSRQCQNIKNIFCDAEKVLLKRVDILRRRRRKCGLDKKKSPLFEHLFPTIAYLLSFYQCLKTLRRISESNILYFLFLHLFIFILFLFLLFFLILINLINNFLCNISTNNS